MDTTRILLDLAIILLSTKLLGMLMRKLGLPQVAGAVLAGLLIGPAILPQLGLESIVLVDPSRVTGEADVLKVLSELGVIMILFSAGLETNLDELKRTGAQATAMACIGVFVPLILGTLVTALFMGGISTAFSSAESTMQCVSAGMILTATSVGITVETLKEMGKLNTRIGTTILSAAIIDDVIGIVVLSVVLSLTDPTSTSVGHTLLMTVLFFVFAVGVGIPINLLFKKLSQKYDHTRRIPIFGLIVCLVYAYVAEAVFGIADITGAYIAGIILCNVKDTSYIDSKIGVNSYMFFSPIFFASIGILNSIVIDGATILYGLCFVAVGILGKILGCGACAKVCKFDNTDSLIGGVGMIARGEVALVVCGKVMEAGVYESGGIDPTLPTVMLIVISSLLAPILLKALFNKKDREDKAKLTEMYNRLDQK